MAEAKKTTKKKTKAEEKEQLEAIKLVAEEVVEAEAVEVVEEKKAEKVTAKAGKRSEKALKEAEEKQAKEERKAEKAESKEEVKPKITVKPPRTRLERRSKGYRKAAELIDTNKEYSLAEALELAVKTSPVKFDASVELHVNLGVDPKQADQNIRGTVTLPAGTGKTVRVAVFAEPDDAKKAIAAGADFASNEELLAQLEKGVIDFDILIATPALMAKLGKYAKVLGPKGLMPNPKSGTVAADVAKAVTAAKAGRIEYRVDSTGIIHVAIGKVSFGAAKLGENATAIMQAVKAAKPASLKGIYIQRIHIASTMGPSIRVAASGI